MVRLWFIFAFKISFKFYFNIYLVYILSGDIYKCVWWKRTSAGWSWTNQLIITKWTSEFRNYCFHQFVSSESELASEHFPRRSDVPQVLHRSKSLCNQFWRLWTLFSLTWTRVSAFLNYLVPYQVIFRMRRLRTGSKHCLLSNDILDLDPFPFSNASFESE